MDKFRDIGPSSSSTVPVDRWHLVYAIMLLQGLGNLYAWNVFITAAQYFSIRFCGTPFESSFENYLSISNTLSQTLGLALSVVYQEKYSLRSKVIYPLLCYSLVFGATTTLVTVNVGGNALFWITFMSSCICGFCGAFLSAGLFSLGAILPSNYTGALMTGQGLAGLVVSLSSMLTTYASAPDSSCAPSDDDQAERVTTCSYSIDWGSFAYFALATVILLTCVLLFVVLEKLPFTQYFIRKESMGGRHVTTSLLHGGDDADEVQDEADLAAASYQHDSRTLRNSLEELYAETNNSGAIDIARLIEVLKDIKVAAFSVFLTFTVTIGVFPSLVVLLRSKYLCKDDNRMHNDLFTPFLFVLFNLFDFAGRTTAGITGPWFTKKSIWIVSIARLVFIPLFMLSNVTGSRLPTIFQADAYPIVFMILFAFSNGYVASNCMMMSSGLVSIQNMSLAGTMMIFFLTFGLLSGASSSFLVVFISQGKI